MDTVKNNRRKPSLSKADLSSLNRKLERLLNKKNGVLFHNCSCGDNEELEVLYNSYTEGPEVINLCDSEEEADNFMASQTLLMDAAASMPSRY